MAGDEALGVPEAAGAVFGEALGGPVESGQSEPYAGGSETGKSKPPRLCLECRRALGVGERKLHRDRCAHQRKIRLQRLRRGRRRR